MKRLNGTTRLNQVENTDRTYFDLDGTYTVCFISRLLGISKKMALRYVSPQGKLTVRGGLTLHDLNEELRRARIHATRSSTVPNVASLYP